MVEGFIFGGGLAPAEVLAHGFDPHLMKDMRVVATSVGGPRDGFVEALRVQLPEFKAGADLGLFMMIDDAVVESSGCSDDGESAVAHAVHLVETAGLKVGGHEEEVGACFDAVGDGFAVGDMGGAAKAILRGDAAEGSLGPGLSRS